MNYARDHAVNNLRYNEHRYVAVGRYIADALPPRSVFLAMQESGSVRYYAGRETIRWDFVPAADLNGVLDQLRRLGYHPYLLLETWEEAQFKSQFHGHTALADLDWAPVAAYARDVRIYDPLERGVTKTRRPVRIY